MIQNFLAALVAFLLTLVCMPIFINYQHAKKEGQQIREEGPKWHQKKSGTPIMGGAIFIAAIVISTLFFNILSGALNSTYFVLILGFLGFGIVGFLDDGIKLLKKRNMGLKAYQKLLGQILIAIFILIILVSDQFSFAIQLPIFGEINSLWFFGLFLIFWLVGFSNAVNLSDGLDGLATGLAIIAYGTYGVIAYQTRQSVILMFCLAVVGGLLGFLLFNHKPAKIFMGDVGSLALGGGLAIISLLLGRPWSLLLIGIVFVGETLSVILQVASFKLTGKRIFKMTPIHHHFEMSGLNEWQIDFLFWGVGLIAAIIYLLIF